MYYGCKKNSCQYLPIKKRFSEISSTGSCHEKYRWPAETAVSNKKGPKPRLYPIYLCIVIRCIMNIKIFFVNTLSTSAYACASCTALAAVNYHPAEAAGRPNVPHFHCQLSRVNTSEYQTAVFSSQAKTILQAHVHLGLPRCIGDIIQIAGGVGSLIIYGWVNNPLIHY